VETVAAEPVPVGGDAGGGGVGPCCATGRRGATAAAPAVPTTRPLPNPNRPHPARRRPLPVPRHLPAHRQPPVHPLCVPPRPPPHRLPDRPPARVQRRRPDPQHRRGNRKLPLEPGPGRWGRRRRGGDLPGEVLLWSGFRSRDLVFVPLLVSPGATRPRLPPSPTARDRSTSRNRI